MSEISIDTLKTMLANLDDAKKYQSLRDVMETLPAPDLAAVFEDLPAEKLPVLFRLCPKDLAADVFTELAPETQQKLIDGLTDTELKAVVDELFVDDATDLVEEMPANVVKRILGQADPTTRRMINELLKYPEDSAPASWAWIWRAQRGSFRCGIFTRFLISRGNLRCPLPVTQVIPKGRTLSATRWTSARSASATGIIFSMIPCSGRAQSRPALRLRSVRRATFSAKRSRLMRCIRRKSCWTPDFVCASAPTI